ncbi:peroxisomal membrane protein PMP34-like isoform X2 [Pollicipes pollicipes]|uniref:peroxisomal membrane protein PMP34-like isoform X2 n=1 Tax=Pollicipes pollicipes TaxID=41117 RepID=UPI001884FDBE|nr:peroxisomal membrane protein PMP34-like isoform X2 [Pollicipes pollicipes]XP_037083372.1 peroxisomal membrane protein PMP34-like isoform X2 [Pollicipes pollicipes]
MRSNKGSSVAMSLTYPLDTVRTRLQLEEGRRAAPTAVLLVQLARQEGITSLYRGIVPVIQSLFSSNFVYFYTFHGLKRLVVGEQSAPKDLLMAMTAGCVNVLLTNPLWVANTRMKMEGVAELSERVRGQARPPASRRYRSLADGVRRIATEEGTGALYNGLTPSLMLTSNPAVQFVAYEAAKRYLERLKPGVPLSATTVFVVGAACKALATIITYPLQMVQAKLRVGGLVLEDGTRELRVLRILLLLYRHGGLAGVFKGLEAKMLQTVLTAALMFVLYEKIARFVFFLLLGRRG